MNNTKKFLTFYGEQCNSEEECLYNEKQFIFKNEELQRTIVALDENGERLYLPKLIGLSKNMNADLDKVEDNLIKELEDFILEAVSFGLKEQDDKHKQAFVDYIQYLYQDVLGLEFYTFKSKSEVLIPEKPLRIYYDFEQMKWCEVNLHNANEQLEMYNSLTWHETLVL